MKTEDVSQERPLPAGSIIEYGGFRGEVAQDNGGMMLYVKVDGVLEKWYWELDGITCKVISRAGKQQDHKSDGWIWEAAAEFAMDSAHIPSIMAIIKKHFENRQLNN